jgi:hypothetical protein
MFFLDKPRAKSFLLASSVEALQKLRKSDGIKQTYSKEDIKAKVRPKR